jgi:hypothetical protein
VPVAQAHENDPVIAGPLGGLWLSAVRIQTPISIVRALRWWREMSRLGVNVPLFVAHDFGLLYAVSAEQIRLRDDDIGQALAGTSNAAAIVMQYRALVAELAADAGARIAQIGLTDDLIAVVLVRLLAGPSRIAEVSPPWPQTLPLDVELVRELEPQLPRLFSAVPRRYDFSFLKALTSDRLRLLATMDALDVNTLRLLAMFPDDPTYHGSLAQVDLLAALSSAMANDVVEFSLELLPRVLETRRSDGPRTHSADGYGGVGRYGSIDSMVLTELAWSDEELARRALEGEILFFAREQASGPAARLHHVLVDASASMRGDREVFARGLAIGLAKKLQLGGEEVRMRFFDSRLYDIRHGRSRSALPLAWVLGFKGERGRNPARVLAQLATELDLLRTRDPRDPVVHLITHAALHVPRAIAAEVGRLAHLFCVFILPSGGVLDLDWLDLVESYAVVGHETLKQQSERVNAGARIIDDIACASRPDRFGVERARGVGRRPARHV